MISRRGFLKVSGLAGLGLTLQPFHFLRANTSERDDHFLLQIFVQGGLDNSLLFDARPLEMTQNKLIHNYLGQEPTRWDGNNGQSTWATSLADPLKAFKSSFSICNGLIMAPTFDGHLQNVNYFFTGNPFGGECFLPHLNSALGAMPIDSVVPIFNFLFNDVTNGGSQIQLDYDNLLTLVKKLKVEVPLNLQDPLWSFISERYEANARLNPKGLFSRGSGLLSQSLPAASRLEFLLKEVQLAAWDDQKTKFLPLVGEFFKRRIARTAVFQPQFETNVDCHDAASAKAHPKTIADTVDYIVKTLNYLKATPFDDKRSLMDVTTLVVGSEFSRTMRQKINPIDNTGTDHNNYTNSVLLAGKGIKGGLVLGASDFASSSEKLSGAHMKVDQERLKIMGRPFDFSNFTPRSDLPETYKYQDYLHFHSVVNTIYELFDVPKSKYRSPERDAPAAPVLRPLLSISPGVGENTSTGCAAPECPTA